MLPGFILEVLLGFFCVYVKMELLNITRGFNPKTNGNKNLPLKVAKKLGKILIPYAVSLPKN